MLILTLLLFTQTSVFCLKKHSNDDDNISSNPITSGDLPIYHSFGDEFVQRGIVTFKSGRSVTINNFKLDNDQIEKLRKLASQDGLYFIKTPTRIGSDLDDLNYVSTFVKACYLYGSGLQDLITFAVDHAGNIIGLSIVSAKSTCLDSLPPGEMFNTTVKIQNQVPGAVPDTQTFVKKMEEEKAEKASGKGKDNRSFFAKYWMYIVPLVVMLMISSQAEPPAEGGNE